jgi:hypothetical protein
VELDPAAQFGRLLVSVDDAEATLSRLGAVRGRSLGALR